VLTRKPILLLALAAASLTGGCGGSSQTHTHGTQPSQRLSGPLIGAMFDGPVLKSSVNLSGQVGLAAASGVESLRVALDWSRAQPYRDAAAVPQALRSQFVDTGGVPTRFSDMDRIVGAAASRGLSVLPVVEYTPNWDAPPRGNRASPPKSLAPFAAFLTASVRRYGPNGTFWAAHPALTPEPIRMWQIWNEPNFTRYWTRQPFASSYVRLLAAARTALKATDPGAKIVLAGFADFSWQYLEEVYRVPGARSLFDLVAIHPYTANPAGVITILGRARAVMDRFGDHAKPLLATEITWPSSAGKSPPQFGVGVTEAQQARRIASVMPLLEANRARLGLAGFYWYTWMGNESPRSAPYGFDFAGLLKYVSGRLFFKAALATFTTWALRIEGCRRKIVADRCA
jgi:hypothetical protein